MSPYYSHFAFIITFIFAAPSWLLPGANRRFRPLATPLWEGAAAPDPGGYVPWNRDNAKIILRCYVWCVQLQDLTFAPADSRPATSSVAVDTLRTMTSQENTSSASFSNTVVVYQPSDDGVVVTTTARTDDVSVNAVADTARRGADENDDVERNTTTRYDAIWI